ncbi:hypothetical protein Ancab_009829 [Ancistrocladus abbreviatus]
MLTKECLCKDIPVLTCPALNIEVYAIKDGVTKWPRCGGAATKEIVPKVLSCLLGTRFRGERVAAQGTANYVSAYAAATIGGACVTVANQVLVGCLPISKHFEECYVDELVVTRSTGGC